MIWPNCPEYRTDGQRDRKYKREVYLKHSFTIEGWINIVISKKKWLGDMEEGVRTSEKISTYQRIPEEV